MLKLPLHVKLFDRVIVTLLTLLKVMSFQVIPFVVRVAAPLINNLLPVVVTVPAV